MGESLEVSCAQTRNSYMTPEPGPPALQAGGTQPLVPGKLRKFVIHGENIDKFILSKLKHLLCGGLS